MYRLYVLLVPVLVPVAIGLRTWDMYGVLYDSVLAPSLLVCTRMYIRVIAGVTQGQPLDGTTMVSSIRTARVLICSALYASDGPL